ncbi:hypothetical protein CDL12_14219 [Handroanthus impetiginosus]|uniref:NB-ARC domain-containing protein n=1 Tax=Handroanthus impetiginosus TaxID=429701 RepID=A0A2G9H6R0_9LAMI|nr:hypothetical protein CDL12_14219 [Handroanthus impetiginosus]
MRGETSIYVWRNKLEKLRDPNMEQDEKEDAVFKALKYSFDKLNLNHQLCFLRCSLYPEDFKIGKKELVERFISEELVNIRKSRQSQLDQGYSILNKIVNVCLLESVDEFLVKMHDLVRSMALQITKGKNLVISGLHLKEIPNEGEWTKDLEKVSLMHNSIMEIQDGMSPNCPNLMTLILHQNPLTFLPDSFFLQLDNLCSLDLSDTRIEKSPNSVSNLENLKALNLRYCWMLGTGIKNVPQGMEELVNLRSLSLIETDFLVILPEGLFLNFPLLQYLHLPFQMKAPAEEISRLKLLEQFWGRMQNVSDFSKCIRCRQNQLTIFIIMVDSGVNKYYGPGFMYEANRNELILHQCDLKNEEKDDLSKLFHDIQFLGLENCKGLSNSLLDDFPRLNKPSSLKVLKISKCGEIECFLTNKQFLTANQELELRFLSLSNLEEIKLIGLQNFIGLIQNIGAAIEPPLPQATVFSSLQSLSIWRCNKMRKLGLPLSEFQNIEEISIEECIEIEEIIEVREGEGRVVSLPKLKVLGLLYLPRLKSICNSTMSCASIERIELVACRELKKLPLYFDPISPQTLKEILVGKGGKEWWESLEWKHPTHGHLLQPLVRFTPL